MLIIPGQIDGKPVTAIGAYALKGNQTVTEITIPASITMIGEQAFANSKLQMIIFQGKAPVNSYQSFVGVNAQAQLLVTMKPGHMK